MVESKLIVWSHLSSIEHLQLFGLKNQRLATTKQLVMAISVRSKPRVRDSAKNAATVQGNHKSTCTTYWGKYVINDRSKNGKPD